MSSELNEQLEAYYKLKHKYEDKIQRLKLKIIRNVLDEGRRNNSSASRKLINARATIWRELGLK